MMFAKALQHFAEWLLLEPGIPLRDPWHYLNGEFEDVIFDQYSFLGIEELLSQASSRFQQRRMQGSMSQNLKSQRMADSTLTFARELCRVMKIEVSECKEWFPFFWRKWQQGQSRSYGYCIEISCK